MPQTTRLKPDFVEIVTWNDFGESHYIGPIYQPGKYTLLTRPSHGVQHRLTIPINLGIPSTANADARPYVENHPHQAWLETLPYQIAAYKHAHSPSTHPAPVVKEGQDKIVYWYRTAPASAGKTDATGNDCPSAINTGGYQTCYPVDEVLEDGIWAIVLKSKAGGSVSIKVGGSAAQEFGGLKEGMNFVSRPFNGETGMVSVSSSTGIKGSGVEILSTPKDGTANFNAWVGCAGAC